MFVEDLGRPGLAGFWAEADAAEGAPAATSAGARVRRLVESPGSWSPVPVATALSGPRATAARTALHAFKDSLDADRSAALVAS